MAIYRRYLRYSDYDRVRHRRRMKKWLSRVSAQLAGTGATQVSFNVDLNTQGGVFTTTSAHGFSVGDGPLRVALETGGVRAVLILTVAAQPTVGDTVTVNGLTTRTVYAFIAAGGTPSANEIAIGANVAGTATNLVAKLNSHPDLSARIRGNGVSLTVNAAADGAAGNGNSIESSNDTAITGEGSLVDGSDPVPAAPLIHDGIYFIRTVPTTMSFTLSSGLGGPIIRPSARSAGQYALVQGTSAAAIYELLKRYDADIIDMEDDIDDLV